MILTRMQPESKCSDGRSFLRQDRGVDPMDAREEMTTDVGKAAMARGCVTVNACGPAGVTVVGVGVGNLPRANHLFEQRTKPGIT
jgi:hypothetical protein